MTAEELAAIVARDADGPTAHPGPVKTYGLVAAVDRHGLLALVRETRDALRLGYDELLAAPYAVDRPIEDQLVPRLTALDEMLYHLNRLAALDPEPVR